MASAWKSSRPFTAVGVGLAFLLVVANIQPPSKIIRVQSLSETESSELSFTAYNEYTADSPITNYPWDTIVEPFRETTLEAAGSSSDTSFTWSIEADTYPGQVVTHTFTKVGIATVLLTSDSGSHVQGEVMVKYVRREIRGLSHEDRNKFFTALHTVYHVNTTEGRERYGYGSKYKHISYFARQHLAGAAARDCDHWHDGAGLMVHHMSFTLELEQALQAIDPTLTVPYWDYSIDAYEYVDAWLNSKIFDPDWFGPVHNVASMNTEGDQVRGLHVVSEGRWAYTPIMGDARGFSDITNGWGLLRSPWNQNPTPFLTRWTKVFNFTNAGYDTFPDCKLLFTCFAHDNLVAMNECLNGDTHGPVHVMLGGQWHNSALEQHVVHYYTTERIQLLIFKNLWRHGYATCPETCADGNSEDCQCSCPSTLMDGRNAYDVLNETRVLHWLDQVTPVIYFDTDSGRYKLKELTEAHEDKQWHMILQAHCNPGYVGELYTSNAPYDPLFWPIHTQAERLLGWKRILSGLGYVDFNETWGYSHPANTPSDTGVVCDWENVGTDGLSLPQCEIKECKGHGEDDLLPGGNFLDRGETYTNAQFYEFMNPYNEELPYLYDNFDWVYCDETGYRMSSINWFHDDDSVQATSSDSSSGSVDPQAQDVTAQMSDDKMDLPPIVEAGP